MNGIGPVLQELLATSGYWSDWYEILTKPAGRHMTWSHPHTKMNKIGHVVPEMLATSGYDVLNGLTVMKS